MNVDQLLVREWNAGASVKQAYSRLSKLHGVSKQRVVSAFRAFARQVGYSGCIPVNKARPCRPYAADWRQIDDKLWHSDELKLYWRSDLALSRDEYSANWAGWIGPGAELARICA